ncbi:NUDIX hydrolase [Glutamicibacter sp. M10]|uniref:NUDIX hydrolase n=1 Tax=Glutamicibacter sp. M10 TaxID=3023076 RepID=UPI0029057655|nr:NUDIX hydrolase [Glutamicibacter sp. M10]
MAELELRDPHARVREIIRSVDADEISLGDYEIIAAGAIPWRILDGKLQVLLIHRPKYDDWSWPKGKLDPGESIAECAIREVREEIGLRIALGIPLSATAYSVKNKSKVVYYWAAKTDPLTVIQPDGGECDETKWMSVKKAREMLTNPTDAQPLEDLAKAHKNETLNAQPVLIVRHAKAKPRGNWTKEEGERPLAATGRRQAQAVSRMLEAWQPAFIATSPWVRCVQTLAPYAALHAMKMRNVKALTEHAATRHPERARKAVQKLLISTVLKLFVLTDRCCHLSWKFSLRTPHRNWPRPYPRWILIWNPDQSSWPIRLLEQSHAWCPLKSTCLTTISR